MSLYGGQTIKQHVPNISQWLGLKDDTHVRVIKKIKFNKKSEIILLEKPQNGKEGIKLY